MFLSVSGEGRVLDLTKGRGRGCGGLNSINFSLNPVDLKREKKSKMRASITGSRGW